MQCRFLLAFGLVIQSLSVSSFAHLLNMTEAELRLGNDEIRLTLDVDVSKSYDNRQAYYEASQQRPCALLAEAQPNAHDILAQIELVFSVENALAPAKPESLNPLRTRVDWTDIRCRFEAQSQAAYLDYLQWPKVCIEARAEMENPFVEGAQVYGVFHAGFGFEEPIALTFKSKDERKMTRWLIAEQRSPAFPVFSGDVSPAIAQQSVVFYLKQGFIHILPKGLDHILFVMALVFTTVGIVSRLKLLTAFTVAHSLSMAAVVWNAISLNMRMAEVFIALSIVWVGLECLGWIRTQGLRLVIVFFFGLVHGLGFANILSELTLPYGQALVALLSFNLGVELGQLVVVAGLMTVLAAMSYSPSWYERLRKSFACLAIVAGGFWAVQRAFSL